MLVTGAGLIGLTATAIATRAGARVIVADPDPARRTLARSFGAAAMIDPARGGRPRAGRCDDCARRELDIAIEASGAPQRSRSALDEIGVGGVVVLVGSVSPGPSYALDPERTVRNLTTVRGVHNYDPGRPRAARSRSSRSTATATRSHSSSAGRTRCRSSTTRSSAPPRAPT